MLSDNLTRINLVGRIFHNHRRHPVNFSNFPYICLQIGCVDKRLDAVRGKKFTDRCIEILKKISSATSSKATSFKLGEYNLLPGVLKFWFKNCEKFNFGKRYLPSDSHANTVRTLIVAAVYSICKKRQKTAKNYLSHSRWFDGGQLNSTFFHRRNSILNFRRFLSKQWC